MGQAHNKTRSKPRTAENPVFAVWGSFLEHRTFCGWYVSIFWLANVFHKIHMLIFGQSEFQQLTMMKSSLFRKKRPEKQNRIFGGPWKQLKPVFHARHDFNAEYRTEYREG
jgi:hypothetical protein